LGLGLAIKKEYYRSIIYPHFRSKLNLTTIRRLPVSFETFIDHNMDFSSSIAQRNDLDLGLREALNQKHQNQNKNTKKTYAKPQREWNVSNNLLERTQSTDHNIRPGVKRKIGTMATLSMRQR
jgi:hypothetical protein